MDYFMYTVMAFLNTIHFICVVFLLSFWLQELIKK